jgi:hypothetical protein
MYQKCDAAMECRKKRRKKIRGRAEDVAPVIKFT